MSNVNNESLVKKEIVELLSLKGLDLTIEHSNGVVNPRKNSHTTWVGVDTKMPNSYLSSTTVAEYAEAYFKGRDLNEAEYIWSPIALNGDVIGTEGLLLDDAEGFMFIKVSDAALILNRSAKNSDDQQLNEDIEKLFNNEVEEYRAWDNDNIFNVGLSAKSDDIFNVQIKDCYHLENSNTNKGAIVKAVDTALIDINNQIERAGDAITLTLNIEASDEYTYKPLEYIVDQLNSVYKLNLTIGHYYYDKFNKTLDLTILGRSISNIAAIRKACKKDFELLEDMSKQIERLVEVDGFERVDALKMAEILLDDEGYNYMPDVMQQALIRSIITNISGVTIEGLVWKNS